MKTPDVHEAANLLRRMRVLVRHSDDLLVEDFGGFGKRDLDEVDDFLARYDAGYVPESTREVK